MSMRRFLNVIIPNFSRFSQGPYIMQYMKENVLLTYVIKAHVKKQMNI